MALPPAAVALVLVAQLTGEPWKPCAFNDTPIPCRERHRGDRLQVEWNDGQGMTYTRLPQGNRVLTHVSNGNRILLPLRPDDPPSPAPLPAQRW